MEFNKTIINMVAQDIKETNYGLDEVYKQIDNLVGGAIRSTQIDFSLNPLDLEYFFVGEHILGTNLFANAPITLGVSLKTDPRVLQIYKRLIKEGKNKKINRFLKESQYLNDIAVANTLFKYLVGSCDSQTKLFVNDNIIILQLDKEIKVKIIVGYNTGENFEYNYLNKFYIANFKLMLKNFKDKQKEASDFVTIIRLFKSIEVELIKLKLTRVNIFEKFNLLEHLIYNVPTQLLVDKDFDKVVLKVLNYLKNSDFSTFKRADLDMPLFESNQKTAQYNLSDAQYIVKAVEYFLSNLDNIYKPDKQI